MSLPDESNIEEAQAKEGNTVKDSGRFKRSTYVGVGSFTSQTLIKYVHNGKKTGTKSAERYKVYAEARTIEEALSLGSRVADFLNDFEKRYPATFRRHGPRAGRRSICRAIRRHE